MHPVCPLCSSSAISEYYHDKRRSYCQCACCHLVFVPPEFHTEAAEEKRIYDLHENDPYDPGYRRFLSRLAVPLQERVKEGSRGLDFGCGLGPALAMMLEEAGHSMALYDLYYHDDRTVLEGRYDFICATEVFEHLRQPVRELETLLNLLNSLGVLAVMTKLVIGPEAFSRWHYIQDQTHICFFCRDTFRFIADKYGLELEFIDRDVIFLRKQ